MSLTGGVKIGVPFAQARLDAGAGKNRIADWYQGRRGAAQPKVGEHKSSDSLTVKANGARVAINLSAMHRAATQPGRVALDVAPVASVRPTVANAPVTQADAPIVSPTGDATIAAPFVAAPTPREALTALRADIDALRTDVLQIGVLHREARTDAGWAVGVAGREATLMERQSKAQAKVDAGLSKIETLISADSAGPTGIAADLADVRKALLTLAVEIEFPQTVGMTRAEIRPLPALGSGGGTILAKRWEWLDRDLGRFAEASPGVGDPDRRGDASGMLLRIDNMIDRLDALAPSPGTDIALVKLKEARAAVQLRVTLDSAVASLGALRDRFRAQPELAAVSTGRLLKAFSHFGTVHRDAASTRPTDQLHALEVVDSLAHLLSTNAVPDVFVTEDPVVKTLLTALRIDRCRDLALGKRLADETDPRLAEASQRLTAEIGRAPTKAELGNALAVAFEAELGRLRTLLGREPDVDETKIAAIATGKAGFDKTMAQGQLAAATKEAYFNQRGRVERILGANRAAAHRPAIWLKLGIGGGQGRPEVQRDAAILRQLGKDNPQAAFMVAGLVVLEHQVAMSDIEVLGLPQYEGLSLMEFDVGRVLAFAGVTEDEMVKLGYSAAEAADFPKSMHNLGKAGFKNVAELTSHIDYLDRAAQATFSNRSMQDMIGDAAAGSAGAIGNRLLGSLLSDAASVGSGLPKVRADPGLKTLDAAMQPVFAVAVTDGFRAISAAAKAAIDADPGVAEALRGTGAVFEAVDADIVTLLSRRAEIDGRVAAARTVIQTAKAAGPIKDLDLGAEKPGGLRSAKAIITALDKHAALETMMREGGSREAIEETLAARDAALDSLRGLDQATMRRPWHAKIANLFSAAERPKIDDLANLRGVAENIVYIREKAAQERENLPPSRHAEIDTRLAAARAAVRAATTTGQARKLDIDPENPVGLRSAKTIIVALDADAALRTMVRDGSPRQDIAEAIAVRDAALDSLRGFDADAMHRPWHAKLSGMFSSVARPEIEDLGKLRGVAESIIYLREDARAKRQAVDNDIGTAASLRQDMLDERQRLSRAAVGTAEQMVRTAVLAHWPADNLERRLGGGKVEPAYQPALQRAEIEATLTLWGFDTALFAPEISATINSTLERHDLATWAGESRPVDRTTHLVPTADARGRAQRFGDSLKTGIRGLFTREGAAKAALYLSHKKKVDDAVQAEIGALHQAMKEGDKFDFKTGYKLALNTGKIPLDPSATLGIRGRVAVSSLSNLALERGSDGFKVTARFGAQAQLGVDLIADQYPSDNVKIGGSVGAELTGSYLGGYSETFPNTADGRQACSDLIMSLAAGDRPSAKIFESVTDAAVNSEIAGKIGVGAKAYASAELTARPLGDDGSLSGAADDRKLKSGASNKLGIGASATLEVAAALGGKYSVVRSFNRLAVSSEKEISTSLTLSASVYAKLITATGAASAKILEGAQRSADGRFDSEASAAKTKGTWNGGNASTDEQLVAAEVSAALARTKRYKQEYSLSDRRDGAPRLAKAEMVQRTTLRLGADLALIGIGSRELAEKLEADPAFRADYQALKAQMGRNDLLQITYALTPAHVERIGDLMATADDHAREGNRVTAAFLRHKATSLLDNQESYEATKITLVTKQTTKDAVNRGNAVLLRFDITAEIGSESAELTLKVPAKTVA